MHLDTRELKQTARDANYATRYNTTVESVYKDHLWDQTKWS